MLTISHIGKETNLLEEQAEGVALTDPQTVYRNGSEWEAIRDLLETASITRLAELSGVSERMLRDLRQGTRRPSAETLEAIAGALGRMLDDPVR